jgi:catalase (peroxidase I)
VVPSRSHGPFDMRLRCGDVLAAREERIDVPDKEHSKSVSESENPAIPSPTPKRNRPRTNNDWWPNQLDLSMLHHHHSHLSNPMEEDFNYAEQF